MAREIEIRDPPTEAWGCILYIGNRDDGTGGAMALRLTDEEMWGVYKGLRDFFSCKRCLADMDKEPGLFQTKGGDGPYCGKCIHPAQREENYPPTAI